MCPTRREVMLGAAAAVQPGASDVVIDPAPRFELSPYLYMQFMEPLGTSDGSVEAAWDYDKDDWRRDLVEATRDLAPGAVRWGGLYSRYYKWREGIGPADKRPAARNYVWGGKESNRVGTAEFIDFCRRVDAEPLMCVNFMGDGDRRFASRWGDAREAAEWAAYAPEIKLWQIGNETSYGNAGFRMDEAIAHTIEFAQAMKKSNSAVRLIGWGDRGRAGEPEYWAGPMLDRAGEYLDYIAIHMMGQTPQRQPTLLDGCEYQKNPRQAFEELIEMTNRTDQRVRAVEAILDERKARAGLAITEGHLSLRPHNTNPILLEWLTGAYHARTMNIYQRHGARIKIATLADFCGNRWTVNAVLMATPGAVSYLTPAGAVMRLFKRHNGRQAVEVTSTPSGLDIAASRTGNKLYLHMASLEFARSVPVVFRVPGKRVTGGRVFEIAPQSPREYVNQARPDVFRPRELTLTGESWSVRPASVSVVELDIS